MAALLLSAAVILLIIYLRQPTAASISSRNAGATAEAQSFATAQVYRQATRLAADSTSTVEAHVTSTAQAIISATQQAHVNKTATSEAHATAQAPATQTAAARQFEQDQTQADATAQAMGQSANLIYGPADGSLVHATTAGDVPCESGTPDHLTNFIVEARFYNPYPPSQHAWDYGFALTNSGREDQYAAALDSEAGRFFSLQAPGYTIQYRNSTNLIDLSEAGSNLVRLYVQAEVAHLYINGHFSATQDLDDLRFDIRSPSNSHVISLCTGLREGELLPGATTRFEGFSVWSVP